MIHHEGQAWLNMKGMQIFQNPGLESAPQWLHNHLFILWYKDCFEVVITCANCLLHGLRNIIMTYSYWWQKCWAGGFGSTDEEAWCFSMSRWWHSKSRSFLGCHGFHSHFGTRLQFRLPHATLSRSVFRICALFTPQDHRKVPWCHSEALMSGTSCERNFSVNGTVLMASEPMLTCKFASNKLCFTNGIMYWGTLTSAWMVPHLIQTHCRWNQHCLICEMSPFFADPFQRQTVVHCTMSECKLM